MTNVNLNTFEPSWVSPPGDTILDLLEERGWSQKQFADRIGYTTKHVNQLVKGNASITDEAAIRLERVLGSNVRFWLMREAQYREALARQRDSAQLRNDLDWLSQLPLADMRKHGWIKRGGDKLQQIKDCLRFFGVASVAAWRDSYSTPIAAFKASPTLAMKPGPTAAWLRRGEVLAGEVNCPPFSKQKFKAALSQARKLTTEKDITALAPKLSALCAPAGVALVFVPTPTGCPATGATLWLGGNKAVMMLSLRYKKNDHMWFAFFHEAGHLLLHNKKLIVEFEENKQQQIEEEADRFARDQLIPRVIAKELPMLDHSEPAIIEFATKAKIAPGIVVGRLQKEFGLAWSSSLNKLKVSYQWPKP